MEGGDSEFADFTLPTLKAFLEARSHNESGSKQELVARAIGCPKTHLFLLTRDPLVSQRHFFFLFSFFFLHPPSPFHGNFCNCNSIGICTASRF